MQSSHNSSLVKNTAVATTIAVGAGIAFAASFLVLPQVTGPLPLRATITTTEQSRTFDVSGNSEVSVMPDEAQARVGVEVSANNVAAAQEQMNQRINRITTTLLDIGFEESDIRTSNYNIRPNYDYERPNRRITGYNVSSSLEIKTTEFESMNEALDAVVQAGANNVSSVQFIVSDEKREEIMKDAREDAITEAKEKAKDLAGLAGMQLGRIVNVSESNPISEPREYFRAATFEASDAAPSSQTELNPGQQDLTYNVTLSYEVL